MKGVVEEKIQKVEELFRKDEEVFIGTGSTLRYPHHTVNNPDKRSIKTPQKASRTSAFSRLNTFHRISVFWFRGHKVYRVPNFPPR